MQEPIDEPQWIETEWRDTVTCQDCQEEEEDVSVTVYLYGDRTTYVYWCRHCGYGSEGEY